MKYINEEGKAYCMCTKEVQDELDNAFKNRNVEALGDDGIWFPRRNSVPLSKASTYRAPIKERKKIRPSDLAGMWGRYSVNGFLITAYDDAANSVYCGHWVNMEDIDSHLFSKDRIEWFTLSQLEQDLSDEWITSGERLKPKGCAK